MRKPARKSIYPKTTNPPGVTLFDLGNRKGRIVLNRCENRELVELRKWVPDEKGEWQPTKNCLIIPIDCMGKMGGVLTDFVQARRNKMERKKVKH